MSFEKPHSASKRRRMRMALQAAVASAALSPAHGHDAAAASELHGLRRASREVSETVHEKGARAVNAASWIVRVERTVPPDAAAETREAYIADATRRFRATLRENAGTLDHGDPDTAFDIALQKQPRIDPRLFEGTRYDFRHLKKRLFMFAVRADAGERHAFLVPSGTGQDTARRFFVGLDKAVGYGNVAFTGSRTMLMPAHVAAMLGGSGETWRGMPDDIVFADAPAGADVPSDRTVDTGKMPATRDLDGRLVIVLSADPDTESDAEGFKAFAGFAVTGHAAVRAATARFHPDADYRRFGAASYMIPLPGEATEERDDFINKRGVSRPIAGSSGGLAFAMNEETGEWEFAGMLWAAGGYGSGNRNAVGFINGPDAIRAAYANEAQRVVIPPRSFVRPEGF